MKFGIIGNHPDGMALAHAMARRHELMAYAGPPEGARWLADRGLSCPTVRDPEEMLARGAIELVIVADDLDHRPQMLRRGMQSEKHVVCVHPADILPDVTYEMAMIQQDTRKVILPILPERLSPAVQRARQLLKEGKLGALQVIEGEWRLPGDANSWDNHPLPRLWDVLRALAGEVRDVSALAHEVDALQPIYPVTLTGRFEQGGIFQLLITPRAENASPRLIIRCDRGVIELQSGESGFNRLHLTQGEATTEEAWTEWQPWEAMASVVEDALSRRPVPVSWQDGTRCLELFEAARTSVKKKRVVSMQYEEFSEASNFKGIMAAGGCLLILFLTAILVFMLAVGIPLVPWLPIVALPLIGIFMLMQLLRWIVPEEPKTAPSEPERGKVHV